MKKSTLLITFLTALSLFIFTPVKSSAADRLDLCFLKANAPQLQMAEEYYSSEYREDNIDHWYKIKTGSQEGVYLISFDLDGFLTKQANATVSVEDQYGTFIASSSGVATRPGNLGNLDHVDALLPVYGLKGNTDYYVKVRASDGANGLTYSRKDRIYVQFVPFKTADNFRLSYNRSGNLVFKWNNKQPYNTYNPLASYDNFYLKIGDGSSLYMGNGGTSSYVLDKNNAQLTSAGYPTKKVSFNLGCSQTYHSYFNELATRTQTFYKNSPIYSKTLKKGSTYTVSGKKYKVTKAKIDGTGEVQLTGLDPAVGESTKMTIGKTVKIQGFVFKITSIGAGAFKNNKTRKEVTIGANITKINDKAFKGCSRLKTVDIKTKVLKSVGKSAFSGMNSKGVIKVPSKVVNKYQKLLKGKCPKNVRIA